jgi:hypothetical protein
MSVMQGHQCINFGNHWTVKEMVAFKLQPYDADIAIINVTFFITYFASCVITFLYFLK